MKRFNGILMAAAMMTTMFLVSEASAAGRVADQEAQRAVIKARIVALQLEQAEAHARLVQTHDETSRGPAAISDEDEGCAYRMVGGRKRKVCQD